MYSLSLELGTRNSCRDNLALFWGQTIVASPPKKGCPNSILNFAGRTFFIYYHVTVAWMRCRIVLFVLVKHCREPSAALLITTNPLLRMVNTIPALSNHSKDLSVRPQHTVPKTIWISASKIEPVTFCIADATVNDWFLGRTYMTKARYIPLHPLQPWPWTARFICLKYTVKKLIYTLTTLFFPA